MRVLPAFVLLLFVAGCKHVPAIAECPAHEGTAWREITSPHFRVRTNLDQQAARASTVELERRRKALLFAWGGRVDPPGRMDVVILQSHAQLGEFANENAVGFVVRDGEGHLMILGGDSYAANATPDQWVITHELAHYLSAYVLLRQPRWISEGMAEYLTMTRPYGDSNEYRMGEANPYLLKWVRNHGRVSWGDLWRWDDLAFGQMTQADARSYYATSWLWVHFLMNQHPQPFSEFQRRLGMAEEPRSAWSAAFGSIPQEELERQLRVYLDQGTYSAFRYPVEFSEGALTERPVSEGEVHAVRARLSAIDLGRRNADERKARVQEEIRLALEREPDNIDALSYRTVGASTPAERLQLARELTDKHPERPEGWILLTTSLFGQPDAAAERRAAAVKAVQLAPDDATALNNLAWDYVQSGQAKTGLSMAGKAARLEPWNAAILDTWAAALAGSGKCPDAVSVQKRAIDMLGEHASRDARADFEKRLRRYEGGCSTASAAP